MRAGLIAVLALLQAGPGLGESLVATRMIAAQAVVTAEDMTVVDAAIPGALSDPEAAIGLQARRIIYAGRPILRGDLGPAIVIGRNALVRMRYRQSGLEILAEGRAMEQGSAGGIIRVMSLASRNIVSGEVLADGTVAVGGAACAGC